MFVGVNVINFAVGELVGVTVGSMDGDIVGESVEGLHVTVSLIHCVYGGLLLDDIGHE